MPLVRYEIGDYAIAREGNCSCGRTLPLIGRVAGRAINLFRSVDGSLFSPWALTGPLRTCSEIDQFQVVQKAIDLVVIRYMAGRPINSETAAHIGSQLRNYLGGSASIAFERVSHIARTPNGKFMLALSEL